MNLKHGHNTRQNKTAEYICWSGMIQRCHNPIHKSYPRYGGRGILVCEQWRDNFKVFLDDMGKKPIGLTLERINLDDGYSPKNCIWADWAAQNLNKKNAVRIVHCNTELTMQGYADLKGTSYQAIAKQVQRAQKSGRTKLLDGSIILRPHKMNGTIVPRD